MAIYRYSRWDGSQDVAFPSTEDLFDKLSEQILQGDDLRGALRRMMQHGIERPQGQRGMGMQDLLQRLRDAKERNLERYNLSSMFEDIEQRISDIIEKERQGIDERLQSLQPSSIRGARAIRAARATQQRTARGAQTAAETPATGMPASSGTCCVRWPVAIWISWTAYRQAQAVASSSCATTTS